ncbi:hypothetical protein B0H17DRAFT_999168 [Mycena rosella]|uniref:LIM zinc-binding domain-containing protein n=1 Tax=Mycena rosella TaxID=1033263 RepID=A0AAD7H121_MYCRO|nr:hypothetical protein B0H17DRAFT_999168 [Mycena rosella]
MLMSKPSQPPPGRISQLLPSVKCSNCNLPVPMAELGEHICAPAPPLPTLSIPKTSLNIPKPTMSPGAAASLLPQRLQGLVQRPAPPRNPLPPPSPRSPSSSLGGSRNDRLNINTSGPTLNAPSYQTRSSPLSRTGDGPPIPRSRDPYAAGGDSPVRNRPPVGGFARARSGSNASSTMSSPITARPSFSSGREYHPAAAAAPPPESSVNTQIGGEAGMAGVGRRGFAAAARAAMFVNSPAPAPPLTRANPPRHIDIAATVGNKTSTPPPLSTSTGSSNSPGIAPFPVSPVSPQPYSRRSPSPPSRAPAKAQLQSSASVSSRGSSKPSSGPHSVSQSSGSEYGLAYADSTDYEDDDDDDDDDADLRRVNEMRSGLGSYKATDPPLPPKPSSFESSKSSIQRSNSPDPTPSIRGGRTADERSVGPAPLKHSASKASLSSGSEGSDYGGGASLDRSNSAVVAQAFGLSQTPPSAYGGLGGPGKTPSTRSGHSRGSSSGSAQSAYSARSAVAIGDATPSAFRKGRLERQMDKMADDSERPVLSKSQSTGKERSFSPAQRKDLTLDLSDNGGRNRRSNTEPNSPESRTAKLPTRSRTSPTTERSTERSMTRDDPKRARAARKPKICVRCETKIEDGKWVQMDGGGVLCEKCWKNMYLPKCRRCNLPIEKQAVSSSDGQLKGKYHRECFNCYTCHKPFPDKTFYVLGGKPLCAYHYHEANDSLCAAARCGQPIEGPCAVSHAGDRYHPEHMLCEFPGYGGCKERLDEYWEIDGRMLCERHSRASRSTEDDNEDGDWAPSARAMKRVTRYIDLAGGGR